jgi:hypothetical protein
MMDAIQFSYWLNGFVELNPNAMPTQTQWQIIKDHLALVHQKVTPYRAPPVVGPTIPTPQPFMPSPVVQDGAHWFKQFTVPNPPINFGTITC